jgi:MoaA/NifB/PqqE/SkfB family radical SAM enzyme
MKKLLDIKTGYQCNNKCKFCIFSDKDRELNKTIQEIRNNLLKAKKNGVNDIIITGGEPSIRKDIIKLLNFVEELEFDNVGMYTNARLFSYNNFAERIVKKGIDWFLVSLHGHRKEIHDKMTQVSGSFDQTNKGISNLLKLGADVVNNCTITKTNYKYLMDVARHLSQMGLKSIHFTFVDPIGIVGGYKDIVPSYTEIIPHLHKTIEWSIENGIRISVENIPYCFMDGYEDHVRESEFEQIDWKMVEPFSLERDFNIDRKASKFKKPSCQKCKWSNKCEGIRKLYARLYGDDEFQPR